MNDWVICLCVALRWTCDWSRYPGPGRPGRDIQQCKKILRGRWCVFFTDFFPPSVLIHKELRYHKGSHMLRLVKSKLSCHCWSDSHGGAWWEGLKEGLAKRKKQQLSIKTSGVKNSRTEKKRRRRWNRHYGLQQGGMSIEKGVEPFTDLLCGLLGSLWHPALEWSSWEHTDCQSTIQLLFSVLISYFPPSLLHFLSSFPLSLFLMTLLTLTFISIWSWTPLGLELQLFFSSSLQSVCESSHCSEDLRFVVLPIGSEFCFSESWTERGHSHGVSKQRAWLPALLYDCTGTETWTFSSDSAAGGMMDLMADDHLRFCLETEATRIIHISMLGEKQQLQFFSFSRRKKNTFSSVSTSLIHFGVRQHKGKNVHTLQLKTTLVKSWVNTNPTLKHGWVHMHHATNG